MHLLIIPSLTNIYLEGVLVGKTTVRAAPVCPRSSLIRDRLWLLRAKIGTLGQSEETTNKSNDQYSQISHKINDLLNY